LGNHFGASFRVQCVSGYYFLQEEFSECSKLFLILQHTLFVTATS